MHFPIETYMGMPLRKTALEKINIMSEQVIDICETDFFIVSYFLNIILSAPCKVSFILLVDYTFSVGYY